MRAGRGVVAGLLLLAVAGGSSLWAGPPAGTKVKPNATLDLNAVPRPQSAAQTVPTTPPGSALTADECKDIGGEVKFDQAGICARPFYCSVRDNFGIERAVCLEASK